MPLPVITEKLQTRRDLYKQQLQQKEVEAHNSSISSVEMVRIQRTLQLIEKHVDICKCSIVDVGCGNGVLAHMLSSKGCKVDALDIFPQENFPGDVPYQQGFLPYLTFEDARFEGVVFTDVIADIDSHLFRLSFSEIARITSRKGWLVCSTQLDLHSFDACQCFAALVETEFEIIACEKSYHRLHFYLRRCIVAPERFVRCMYDEPYRLKQLKKRVGFLKLWLYFNSLKPLGYFWLPISFLLKPFSNFVKTSQTFLLFLERLSEVFWGAAAVTHIIILARKKSL
jgi:SAM-dependent methyltransferase